MRMTLGVPIRMVLGVVEHICAIKPIRMYRRRAGRDPHIWCRRKRFPRAASGRSTPPTRWWGVIREKKARCSMPGSGSLTWGASLRLVRKFGKVDISVQAVSKKCGSSTAGAGLYRQLKMTFIYIYFDVIV